MVVKPYSQKQISDNKFIRTFPSESESSDLCWHRDREQRTVEVIEGEGWSLQLDNCIPMRLVTGRQYNIPKELYHRLIKGKTTLVLEITKHK